MTAPPSVGADNQATQQATLGVRYSPGAWRTIGVTYRYNRDKQRADRSGLAMAARAGRKPPLQEVFARPAHPDVPKPEPAAGRTATSAVAPGTAWAG